VRAAVADDCTCAFASIFHFWQCRSLVVSVTANVSLMPSRRKARELALQMLFQWDVGQHPPEEVITTFLTPRKLDPKTEEFARTLFEGAVKETKSLDALLRAQSEHWRLDRMAAVDRNILRLSLYELLYIPENPHAVVLDEALELARRFSTVDSVSFINGVLDGILKARADAELKEGGAKSSV